MACDLTPVLRVLPAETAAEVLALTRQQKESLTEIRLRAGRKTRVRGVGWQKTLRAETTAKDCEETLLKCAEYSLYAVEAELRRGSFALPGGARAAMRPPFAAGRGRPRRRRGAGRPGPAVLTPCQRSILYTRPDAVSI